MLNVFQLITAFGVIWLMTTEPVPWPETVAAPLTTFAPSGPAMPDEPSASSADVVKRTLRRRSDIRGPSISSGQDEEGSPIVARSSDGLCNRKVRRNH